MTTILLTGAAGLIGTAVLRHLEGAGAVVWTTDRRPLDRELHIVADLEDPAAVERLVGVDPEVTVHLSGAVAGFADDLFNSNVLGTVRLLDALQPGSRVVQAGSAAEYGAGDGGLIAESEPPRPVSPYGWAKVAQTAAGRSIAERRGHQLCVVRPFNVVGPHLPPTTALGNMRNQIEAGEPGGQVVVGRLDVVRDYVPVEFVAAVFAAAAVDPDPPAVLNACSGVGIELGDVLEAMIAARGVGLTVTPDPELAGMSAASVVVGDASAARTRYGLAITPDAGDVAAYVLGDFVE